MVVQAWSMCCFLTTSKYCLCTKHIYINSIRVQKHECVEQKLNQFVSQTQTDWHCGIWLLTRLVMHIFVYERYATTVSAINHSFIMTVSVHYTHRSSQP